MMELIDFLVSDLGFFRPPRAAHPWARGAENLVEGFLGKVGTIMLPQGIGFSCSIYPTLHKCVFKQPDAPPSTALRRT